MAADPAVASQVLDVGRPANNLNLESDADVHVLGLPMQDPAILKGTQIVLALIWVEVFFLCEYLAFAFVNRAISWEVLAIFLSLPLTGYFGIMYNSAGLLRCFSCLALLQALFWSVITLLIILVLL